MGARRSNAAVEHSSIEPLISAVKPLALHRGQRIGRIFVIAAVTVMTILGAGFGAASSSHAVGTLGAPVRYADSPLDQTQIQSIRPPRGNRAGPASSAR